MEQEKTLNEQAAVFELAFRSIESEDFSLVDKLDCIDIFADYLYTPSEEDYYTSGIIKENSPVFVFIEKMIDNNDKCREIVREELELREDYELMHKMMEPASEEVEKIISNLNIF